MHSPTIPRPLAITIGLAAFLTGALVSPVAATFGLPAPHAPSRIARPAATQTYPPLKLQPRRAQRGWMKAGIGFQHPLLYVTGVDEIKIYDGRGRNPKLVGEITDGLDFAYGVFVDRRGTLYVTNWGGSVPGVSVYPPGATEPSLHISDGLQRPMFATTDSHDHLFVSDAGTGNIVEYRPGQAIHERVLFTGGGEADGLAFSAAGDLYVAYRSSARTGVEVFRGGKNPGQDLGIALRAPQGLVFDPGGNMVVADTAGADSIDVFAPGQTQPQQVWQANGIPTGLAFDLRSRALFAAFWVTRELRHLKYPGGRKTGPWLRTSRGLQGVAFSPPARQ